MKKHKNKNYYSGSKENSDLKRWLDEKWQNQRGEIGYQKKTDVYSPTTRVNNIYVCNICMLYKYVI